MANQVATFDCRELTTDRIPDLRILHEHQRTNYASLSSQRFLPDMLEWDTFEQEVRERLNDMIPRAGFRNDPMIYNQPARYTTEQVMCGNESGVVGRFQQHIGHVMTMVLQHMRSAVGNKSLRFGDWRPPGAGGPSFYPDLSIYNDVGANFPAHLLVVGEVKTPWTINLRGSRSAYVDTVNPQRHAYERIVGQVANYMKVHGKRFGYITTYEATVFFKQAPAPRGNGTVLYHSRVISHATPSRNVGSGPLSGNVSLRECMLFIACASSENSDYANHETIWTETWESNKSRSAAPGPHDGRIGGGQGGGKYSGGPSSSGGKMRHGPSGQMRQLQDLQVLTQTVAPIGVKWSDNHNTFYFKKANEEPRRVDGYKFFGDKLEVKIDGINMPLRAIIR